MQVNEKAKPFIKWAGGKGQLLGQLDKYLPQRLYNEDFTYVEPFVGGGAMLFHILKNFPHLKVAIINDVNEDLVKAYKTLKIIPSNSLMDFTFIKETGLQKVFQDKNIKNLVDYVFGVETGLDTNARKNRSGDLMANRVASVFDNNGVIFKRQ